VIKFVNAKFEGVIPEFSPSFTDDSFDFPAWIATVNTLLSEYIAEMEAVHLRAGVKKLMEISSQGNLLLQYRLDNANLEAHPERTKTVIGLALNLSLLLASLASPYMPSTSQSIIGQLNSDLKSIPEKWDPEVLKYGHKLGKAEYLFTRIDDKKVAEWKERYGGTQESREAEEKAKELLKAKKEADKAKKKAKKAAKKVTEGSAEASGSATPASAAQTNEVPVTVATVESKDLPIREKPVEK
jgi:methionyl-tRNA synthetase